MSMQKYHTLKLKCAYTTLVQPIICMKVSMVYASQQYVSSILVVSFFNCQSYYRTNFGIGPSMEDILEAHVHLGGLLGCKHKGLYKTINNCLHFQLGLDLSSLGIITSLIVQHVYILPAYAFIAQDFTGYKDCLLKTMTNQSTLPSKALKTQNTSSLCLTNHQPNSQNPCN